MQNYNSNSDSLYVDVISYSFEECALEVTMGYFKTYCMRAPYCEAG